MATIQVFNESENRFYQVQVNLFVNTLDLVNGSPSNADTDYYLKITTNMKKTDGTSFGEFVVRTMADVPTDGPVTYTPTTFAQLVNNYVDYFLVMAEYGQSSSSSSFSSSSSSYIENWSSSSNSSNSSSSSTSSSSSSSSSSSYIENWSSSSSDSSSSSSSSYIENWSSSSSSSSS